MTDGFEGYQKSGWIVHERTDGTVFMMHGTWDGPHEAFDVACEKGTAETLAQSANDRASLLEENRRLREALSWILPMAKGYAAEHPVGRNSEIVVSAAAALTTDKREG